MNSNASGHGADDRPDAGVEGRAYAGAEERAGAVPELVVVEPVVTAVVRGVVPLAGLRDFFDSSFRALGETLERQQVARLGPAFGLYHGPPTDTANLEVGFPTARAVRPEGDVTVSTLPAARVARTVHHGSFDGLGASWERLHAWVREQGLTPGPVMWEVYVTEPTPGMDPRDLRTELDCVVTG